MVSTTTTKAPKSTPSPVAKAARNGASAPAVAEKAPAKSKTPEGRSPMGSLTSKDKKASKNKKPSTMTESKPSSDAGRLQALERALGQIEKNYGSGSIMRLDGEAKAHPGIGSGALSLDLALGGRGFPRGRICEIFGPESSGKTTLALYVVADGPA